jgi:hypothetical protein
VQLKSAEEAKQHMESTGHTNFEESTEAVGSSPFPALRQFEVRRRLFFVPLLV